MYGTLPTHRMQTYEPKRKQVTVSNTPKHDANTMHSKKSEHYGFNYPGRHVRLQYGYSHNCNEILRKSQQNINAATWTAAYPLSNPYSRHSVAVMDSHPYIAFHATPLSQPWPLYHHSYNYHEKHRTSTVDMRSQTRQIPLSKRYPLHSVAKNDVCRNGIDQQFHAVDANDAGVKKKPQPQAVSDERLVKLDTTERRIRINTSENLSPEKKEAKFPSAVCKAACLFLVVSNLFFVLIIGCIVFTDSD